MLLVRLFRPLFCFVFAHKRDPSLSEAEHVYCMILDSFLMWNTHFRFKIFSYQCFRFVQPCFVIFFALWSRSRDVGRVILVCFLCVTSEMHISLALHPVSLQSISHFRVTQPLFLSPLSTYTVFATLQWCHSGRDGVSNYQHHHCLLNRLFRRRSKKTSKLRVTGLCVGNSPVTGELSTQMASNTESVSIWWRHHEVCDNWQNSKLSDQTFSNFV